MIPKVALSNKARTLSREIVDYARANGYGGIEWTLHSPNPVLADEQQALLTAALSNGLEVRYHCSPEVELAHADPGIARWAVERIRQCIGIACEFGGCYITVHVALNETPPENLSWLHATENLTELVEFGRGRGITVCLENLRKGWTSEPGRFLELIRQCGAMVTFDLGHANSSQFAAERLDFLRRVADRTVNAHVYEYEREGIGHTAPDDLSVIGPVLESLLQTSCDWWLIELEDRWAIEQTWAVLQELLKVAREG